ncbi:ATP-binding protein [Virgibacillus ndiopensis]|uniref:ATP-binding protein n=1 Tax=Virgibacillus ndiopensis TaxID=2004408 RepID=UPI000C084B0F|nr:ATP-binding protein [Virgibacillus ndiopensis]
MKRELNENDSKKNDAKNQNSTKQYFDDVTSLPKFMLDWVEENSNDLITVWDESGKVCFVSKSVERILGYSTTELQGTSWYNKISPEDVSYIKSHFDESTSTSQTYNINIRNKDGKYIWTECKIAKIKVDQSGDSFFISTLKDISDKKEAEEMMIRSEKMSIAGQLAAGIAHEIRNPLTSIKGFLQLLQAGVNRKEEYYKIMIDEIEKMETITSELLFISKPMTDNKRVERVDEMIRDVISLLKPQANLKKIEIKWEQTESPSIYCDRSQIKQVFINLLKNATEAMDESGKIEIKVKKNNSQIIIEFIDEGSGIPEEIIHKLGEPFFTTKQNGTGLGLMITTQILEKHDAKLEIIKNKIKGSTFRIIMREHTE